MATFDIHTNQTHLQVKAGGSTPVTFTVTNVQDRPVEGDVAVVWSDGTGDASWATVSGSAPMPFAAKESKQIEVVLSPPASLSVDQTGKPHRFHLAVIDLSDGSGDRSESPPVYLQVAADDAPPAQPFPWWMVAVGAVVALLLVVGIVMLSGPGEQTSSGFRLVTVSPKDGATGVYEAPVVLTFSEPVQRETLEAAFPDVEKFVWSNGDKKVALKIKYTYSDSFGEKVVINLPTSIKASSGGALSVPQEISFKAAIKQTVSLKLDMKLSGHCDEGKNTNFTFLMSGDKNDVTRFGGATFPIEGLPAFKSVKVASVTFHTQITKLLGTPQAVGMGGFVLDLVQFSRLGDIDKPRVLKKDVAPLYTASQVKLGATAAVDIKDEFVSIWRRGGKRIQFRIHPVNVNKNQGSDLVYFRRQANVKSSLISAGVKNPDPTNVTRIDVTYYK